MTEKQKDPSLPERYHALYLAMNKDEKSMLALNYGDFPWTFYVLKRDGAYLPVEYNPEDHTVAYRHVEDVARAIGKYCEAGVAKFHACYHFGPRQLRDCAQYWLDHTLPLEEEPLEFAEKSYKGLTFHRLGFDITPDIKAPCPMFEDIMKRTTNSEAFEAFIGSLFYPQADRQQYLWIYGSGKNGKGSILHTLTQVFGNAFKSEDPAQAKSQFWTSGLVGKRLVAFPDCNHYGFPQTGLFKALTGGDAVRIEKKHEHSYSAELHCKFLFLSNDKPLLTSEKADTRRAIYCAASPAKGSSLEDPATYRARLFEEAPYWLGRCKARYLDLCPTHGEIPVDSDGLDEVISANEEVYEDFTFRNFRIVGDDADQKTLLVPIHLQQIFRMEGISDFRRQRDFIKYLERTHGVKKMYCSLDGKREWRYSRLVAKTNSEKIRGAYQ